LNTTRIASSNAQTLVTQANLDHRTTRTEKLTAPARTIDNLLQQAGELLELSKYTEAIALLDYIIELKPDSSLAWYWRGNSFASLGHYEDAIASYDGALKIKPSYLLARFERTVLLLFLLISPSPTPPRLS
jgi:tetratricopeptide (TPR) repeat protein